MNFSLTPELEKFVQEKVNSGMYTSASEVVVNHLDFFTLMMIYKLRELIS